MNILRKKNLFCVCPAMESLTGGVAIGAGPGGGRPIVGGFLGQKLQVPRNVFTSKGQLVLSYSRFLNFSSSVVCKNQDFDIFSSLQRCLDH